MDTTTRTANSISWPEKAREALSRPVRVLRLARRLGVGPWEALGWLEHALLGYELAERLGAHARLGDGTEADDGCLA